MVYSYRVTLATTSVASSANGGNIVYLSWLASGNVSKMGVVDKYL